MFVLKKSLLLRICVPISLVVVLHGILLYFFVLAPVSKHANENIERDLVSLSRRLYNICDINFDALLLSGMADDEGSVIIKKALTIGQIEDVFVNESLNGIIYDYILHEIVYNTESSLSSKFIIEQALDGEKFKVLKKDKKDFFMVNTKFKPWRWQIIIIKNENNYLKLISRTKNTYLLALGSLTLIFLFLIFFIYQSINIPVSSIIKKINLQKKPDYKGIDVFEFLSSTISRMMESINQGNEKYRILVENSSHLVWEVDTYNRFTYVSQTAISILGYLPDEMIGNTPFSFMPEKEAEKSKINFETYGFGRFEVEVLVAVFIHKDGTPRNLEITGVPIFSGENEFSGYRGICRDVTERINAEKEKIQAQEIAAEEAKLALIGRVAGKLAHDFNNILGIIMGNTELALLDCNDEEIKKTLQITLEQTLRGKNLTKNLVAFAKDQDLKEEHFTLMDKIDLVIRLLKKDLQDIKVIIENSAESLNLFADSGMIEHALVNLIQNSIHALSKTEKPEIYIRAYNNYGRIFIEIEDNGCGIPEEHIDSIYEPSFTLKGSKDVTGSYQSGIKGTGYGMPNVKKYIELHKGTISVESRAGLGTKFTISLPGNKISKEINASKTDNNNYNSYSKKNILLIEDEQDISNVLFNVLINDPNYHSVDVIDTGEGAMELFKRNNYDLVSLDYILKGKLTGMDVYHFIRDKNSDIPILFLSGNIEFLESIKELKINDNKIDHLSKPCQNREYLNAVNKLFEASITLS